MLVLFIIICSEQCINSCQKYIFHSIQCELSTTRCMHMPVMFLGFFLSACQKLSSSMCLSEDEFSTPAKSSATHKVCMHNKTFTSLSPNSVTPYLQNIKDFWQPICINLSHFITRLSAKQYILSQHIYPLAF